MNEIFLPSNKCKPGHCLCNAIGTLVDPPEVGRRVQAYDPRIGWEFITWHNGDGWFFTYWRGDMEQHPCEIIFSDHHKNQNQQQRNIMDDERDSINTSPVKWMPVDVKCAFLPDHKKKYLVYDGNLKDVVMAVPHYPKNFEIGDNPGNIMWFDPAAHYVLTDARWWADVPFPEGEK